VKTPKTARTTERSPETDLIIRIGSKIEIVLSLTKIYINSLVTKSLVDLSMRFGEGYFDKPNNDQAVYRSRYSP